MAQRCGISEADVKKYNTRANFCNTLVSGELVCCSSGSLPEHTPAPNPGRHVPDQEGGRGRPVPCASMATKCGVSGADFTKFNPKQDLCSSLQPGQHVCCGRGDLPDFTPKPGADGSCHAYAVQRDDSCAVIAAANSLTVAKLEEFDKQTWGWNGCKLLCIGTNICLSTGSPPMPAPVEVSCRIHPSISPKLTTERSFFIECHVWSYSEYYYSYVKESLERDTWRETVTRC